MYILYLGQVGDYNTAVVQNFPDGRGENMTLDYDDGTIAFIFLYDRTVMSMEEAEGNMTLLANQIAQVRHFTV